MNKAKSFLSSRSPRKPLWNNNRSIINLLSCLAKQLQCRTSNNTINTAIIINWIGKQSSLERSNPWFCLIAIAHTMICYGLGNIASCIANPTIYCTQPPPPTCHSATTIIVITMWYYYCKCFSLFTCFNRTRRTDNGHRTRDEEESARPIKSNRGHFCCCIWWMCSSSSSLSLAHCEHCAGCKLHLCLPWVSVCVWYCTCSGRHAPLDDTGCDVYSGHSQGIPPRNCTSITLISLYDSYGRFFTSSSAHSTQDSFQSIVIRSLSSFLMMSSTYSAAGYGGSTAVIHLTASNGKLLLLLRSVEMV